MKGPYLQCSLKGTVQLKGQVLQAFFKIQPQLQSLLVEPHYRIIHHESTINFEPLKTAQNSHLFY